MTESLENCSVGVLLQTECHLLNKFISVKGLTNVSDLRPDDVELLRWRADIGNAELTSICFYHTSVFVTNFTNLQWKCCDPLNRHKTVIKKALRSVSKESALNLKTHGFAVKPGEKMCPSCRKATADTEEVTHSGQDSESDFEPYDEVKESLDISMTSIGCSPLKVHGIKDRVSYGKRKVLNMHGKAAEKVAKVLKFVTKTDV